MSSISPIDTKAFAEKVAAKGCDYVDAPVSGGQVGAEAASLTIMVGATDEGFARAKPLFELMGKNITLIGDNGAGQTCKVSNQIVVALNIEAVAEALLFASPDPLSIRRIRSIVPGLEAPHIAEAVEDLRNLPVARIGPGRVVRLGEILPVFAVPVSKPLGGGQPDSPGTIDGQIIDCPRAGTLRLQPSALAGQPAYAQAGAEPHGARIIFGQGTHVGPHIALQFTQVEQLADLVEAEIHLGESYRISKPGRINMQSPVF